MEAIRLEVCIYENEYGMWVSLVLLHRVCLLSFCCMVYLCFIELHYSRSRRISYLVHGGTA